jgi:hypothetical protein
MELSRITYPITFSGRTFTVDDLRVIQTLTIDCQHRPTSDPPLAGEETHLTDFCPAGRASVLRPTPISP